MSSELYTKDGKLYAGDRQVLKGWESFTGWFWFGVEEVEPGYWFGYVQGLESEWGYFDEGEIRALGNMAWRIKKCDLPIAGRRQ